MRGAADEVGLRHLLQREHGVAEARGGFVVAFLRRRPHLRLDLSEHLGAPAFQELARLLEARGVLFARDAPEAGGRARAYDVGKAVAVAFLVGADRVALAHAPALFDEVLRGADDRRGRERAEVAGAVVPHDAAAGEARPFVRRVGAEREVALVVAHEDVEARLVLLYQRGFRQERLRLVLHGHDLEVVDGVDHRADFRRMAGARAEVRADAAPEVLRLAYVYDYAPAVSHEIAAGAVGQFP